MNGSPHFAHAYTTVICDALARFKRCDGYQVRIVTGTDEHGQKVEQSARAAGIQPQEFCDKVSAEFREMNSREAGVAASIRSHAMEENLP